MTGSEHAGIIDPYDQQTLIFLLAEETPPWLMQRVMRLANDSAKRKALVEAMAQRGAVSTS